MTDTKPKIESIPVCDINIKGQTQVRQLIDEHWVAELADAIEGGFDLPPVVVFHDGKTYWLADGFHRYHARAHRLDLTEIMAEVHQGTRRDAVLYACGANATHGLNRTNDDKRAAVMTLLEDEEWGEWSDREIARRCGVDHKTVGRCRKEVTGEIPQSTKRKGADGRTIDTTNIGKNQTPKAPEAQEFDGFDDDPHGDSEASRGEDDPEFDHTDINGRPIPDALWDQVFRSRHIIDQIEKDIAAIRRGVKQVRDQPIGALIRPGFDTALKDAQQQIKHARPHCVCPMCSGDGCDKKSGCKGLGWLSEEQFKALPEDKK